MKKIAPSLKRQVETKAPEKKINQVTQAPIKEKLSSKEATSSTETEDKRNECLSKLSEYFSNQPNTLELDEYLRIQSKISLHRIAWVTMKTSKDNTQNIEKSILSMLEQRDPTLHQSFLKKELKTRNLRLLSVMNELKEISKSFKSPQNIPFQLKYADLKMMHLLVETENKFGRSYNQGARDFTSIINNSMKNRLNKKEKNTQHFEKIISTLQKKANQIEAKMKTYLEENDCTKESDFLLCGRKNQDIDISQMMSESQSVIDQFYKNQFEYNNELYNNFKWSAKNKNYWLHVK